MTAQELKRLLEDGLEQCEAMVEGDGRHFQAVVVSPVFDGLNLVKQHQLVYQVLGDRMHEEVHALSLRTYTPEQWRKAQRLRVL